MQFLAGSNACAQLCNGKGDRVRSLLKGARAGSKQDKDLKCEQICTVFGI